MANFKLFDHVQVKPDIDTKVTSPTWIGVPAVLHTNQFDEDDEFPWLLVFDNDEREFLALRSTDVLEYVPEG